ncbi:hypothetical protein RRG08_038255 [Elysia crispata]|uniref:Uncharacterized protein n=1 Tax=Elysia crispata TaxID=231223 RepID=A0AAE1AMZ7_9GAST|nr:hypothetical protein RRG08_038255 [Elysia crispata]
MPRLSIRLLSHCRNDCNRCSGHVGSGQKGTTTARFLSPFSPLVAAINSKKMITHSSAHREAQSWHLYCVTPGAVSWELSALVCHLKVVPLLPVTAWCRPLPATSGGDVGPALGGLLHYTPSPGSAEPHTEPTKLGLGLVGRENSPARSVLREV